MTTGMNQTHIALIHDLFAEAEEKNLPLWLESGWAIDARLHKISREHEDIDLAFPIDRQSQFIAILRKFGSRNLERTDYGFLVRVRNVLLDCEPCYQHDDNYELKDMPIGSCPLEKQGMIEAVELRCTSWEAILWEYFFYRDEQPQSSWSQKNLDGYALVCQVLGNAKIEELHQLYQSRKGL
jgi:2''-aminoglycoside nucleotidyltransferase